jgi:hypothetical protein
LRGCVRVTALVPPPLVGEDDTKRRVRADLELPQAPLPLVGRGWGWGDWGESSCSVVGRRGETPPCRRCRSGLPPHKGEGCICGSYLRTPSSGSPLLSGSPPSPTEGRRKNAGDNPGALVASSRGN